MMHHEACLEKNHRAFPLGILVKPLAIICFLRTDRGSGKRFINSPIFYEKESADEIWATAKILICGMIYWSQMILWITAPQTLSFLHLCFYHHGCKAYLTTCLLLSAPSSGPHWKIGSNPSLSYVIELHGSKLMLLDLLSKQLGTVLDRKLIASDGPLLFGTTCCVLKSPALLGNYFIIDYQLLLGQD